LPLLLLLPPFVVDAAECFLSAIKFPFLARLIGALRLDWLSANVAPARRFRRTQAGRCGGAGAGRTPNPGLKRRTAMADKRRLVCPRCEAINAVPTDRPAEAAKCGRCHEKLFQGAPLELSGAQLERHVANSDVPVIVDFWAPWCGPCRAMAPIFERAAASLEPRARFVKVNVDDNPEAAQRYGVQSIPALFAFSGGKLADRQVGVADMAALRGWVDRLAA
jgi:thioredoxin 2